MQKQQVFKVKGMQRDASMANANGEFAYEILNMRLMSAEDLSGFSLTNEKGTTQVITGIHGQVIGQCPTNDSLVVFTTSNDNDYIYEIYQNEEGEWENKLLYSGDLNFSVDNPIEALFNYETEDIQKVYWIDGINQLRCINIVGDNINIGNAVETIPSNIHVKITRGTSGIMKAGIVQYYITYITELGSESNIVYMSPLLYVAHENRGAATNDSVACSFTLEISRDIRDIKYTGINVYRLYRSSIDAVPEVVLLENVSKLDTTIEKQECVDTWQSQVQLGEEFNNTKFSLSKVDGSHIGPTGFRVFSSYIWGSSFSEATNTTHYITYDPTSSVVVYNSNINNSDYCTQVVKKEGSQTRISWGFPLTTYTPLTSTTFYFSNTITDIWGNKVSIVRKDTNSFTEEDRDKIGQLVITILTDVEFGESLIKQDDESVQEYLTRIWSYVNLTCLEKCISMSLSVSSRDYYLKLDEVNELPVKVILGGNTIVVDKNIFLSSVTPSDLLFKNKPHIIAETFTAKDNTLFLGNLQTLPQEPISDSIKQLIQENATAFSIDRRSIPIASISDIDGTSYKYTNQLNNTDSISTYKYGEKYRFGIQVQDIYGTWSNPIWICDKFIDIPPLANGNVPCPKFTLPPNVLQQLQNYNIVAVRPLVVYPSINERKVLAQGVVCPTVYNLKDRKENGPYAQASWFMRPNIPGNLYSPFNSEVSKETHPIADHFKSGTTNVGYHGVMSLEDIETGGYYTVSDVNNSFDKFKRTRHSLLYDDVLLYPQYSSQSYVNPSWYHIGKSGAYHLDLNVDGTDDGIIVHSNYASTDRDTYQPAEYIVKHGSWVEFRHNYALRTKGWTFGGGVNFQNYSVGIEDEKEYPFTFNSTYSSNLNWNYIADWKLNLGGAAVAELEPSRFGATIPANKFFDFTKVNNTYKYRKDTWQGITLDNFNTGNSAYYVDSSIVTFNSPELELTDELRHLSPAAYQFRIIGMIPITGTSSDVLLNVETPYNPENLDDTGLHKVSFSNLNLGYTGFRGMVGHSTYLDSESKILSLLIDEDKDGNPSSNRNSHSSSRYEHFPLYPWQSSGTISNRSNTWEDEGKKNVLKRKIMSNLRFSASTYYFPVRDISDAIPGYTSAFSITTENRAYFNTLNSQYLGWKPNNNSSIIWFDGDSKDSISKIHGYRDIDIVYKGNIDSLAIAANGNSSIAIHNYSYGKDIRAGGGGTTSPSQFSRIRYSGSASNFNDDLIPDSFTAKGAAIRYKSSPHAVIAFNSYEYSNGHFTYPFKAQEILPSSFYNHEGFVCDGEIPSLSYIKPDKAGGLYEYNDEDNFISIPHQGIIQIPGGTTFDNNPTWNPKTQLRNYGWLWLGEIYREEDPDFGGTSEGALMANSWEVAGQPLQIQNHHLITGATVNWTQGDTYYQRFDTLKTYALNNDDPNSIVDITSFMVETRINIDGRTDRNRGQESNLQMSPTNFNLMNDVYSQRDNFFTYRILDEDLQARTNFPNQITWSLTKTAGATVDAWMNITLASVLDLDGTKGKISALKNFNNNIIAFQEKGLSHIMFNSRAQIATSEAVPIQIANTGKVDGQQYFTTDVGCQDKWNIVTTPNGLYFVDYFNKSIYKFNGQLEDISTPNGFRSWCYENLNSTANILGYYDIKNKEVMYYIGDTRFKLDNDIKPTWLGFSELTGAFSSFYTYPKAWFANVQDQGLWLLSGDDTNVYTHQTGDYNELLNTDKSFYGLTVITRQDSNTVKTFNNVEFRADSYNGSILDNNNTFNTISAETEYQIRTTDSLTYSQYRPSNLKKKFRTWRANIPRVNNGYNRFVNQWAKIGLWKMNPSTEKTILHDLSVWYSE